MPDRRFQIAVVSPVFNEQEVVEEFCAQISKCLKGARIDYQLVFVDDGSFDHSFELLKKCRQGDPERIKVVRLARNFGHQLAITAGIKNTNADAVIVMDCDLQDPPEVALKFIDKWIVLNNRIGM